jgi:hypothetical protein
MRAPAVFECDDFLSIRPSAVQEGPDGDFKEVEPLNLAASIILKTLRTVYACARETLEVVLADRLHLRRR